MSFWVHVGSPVVTDMTSEVEKENSDSDLSSQEEEKEHVSIICNICIFFQNCNKMQ